MPYKNKVYRPQQDSYYHVYGRSLYENSLYSEHSDYVFFCYLLKKYLTPDFAEERIINGRKRNILANSVAGEVELYGYCLMPNHFHLLVKNIQRDGMSGFMKRVLTLYSGYFNTKYGRQGALLQGGYRAVPLVTDEQFIYVSRYIHLNPIKAKLSKKAKDYKYSSFINYLEKKGPVWLVLHPRLLDATDYSEIESYLKDLEDKPKEGIFCN